jgi:microcin C transport system permease protein
MKKPRLSPVTKKRLRRFIRHRRAWISAWILATLSLLALAADMLANSEPLFVRFQKQNYFPAFRFYPESDFVPNGSASAPNYKELAYAPAFTNNPSNFMLFSPIPYGPSETIDEKKLADQTGNIHIQLIPIATAASLDIDAETKIIRHRAAETFLDVEQADGTATQLNEVWDLNAEFMQAIQMRFQNKKAPPYQTVITPKSFDAGILVSLAPYTPRSRSPERIRLTLRLAEAQEHNIQKLSIIPAQGPLQPSKRWNQMPASDKEQILALTKETIYAQTPFIVHVGPQKYRVTPAAGISWPHPPVAGHPFGIDGAGRDVLARIIHGLRVSLFFSLLLVVFSMALGTMIGAIQGYYGGKVDILVQRAIEIWSAIPFLYVMILLGSIYGASFGLLLFCYGLFNWIGISYYMRGEFLRLRNTPFVDAARVLGLRDHQIILRHILPNALTPIITFAPFSLVGAIASLAALDYLGFGLPALTPSLGQLLHQAQAYRTAWWLILYPSATLFIVILLGVFIGEGVREACDPRPKIRLES